MAESQLRLAIFLGLLVLLLLAEWRWPRRQQPIPRRQRWPSHLALQLVNTVLLRVVFPGAAVAVAVLVEARGWGILPQLSWPEPLAIFLSVVVLDLAIYGQHVATHHLPMLWRLHRLHHSDRQLDVSSALRFHPLEILLSMAWKAVVIVALGAPVMAVLIFEVLLNALAMFNHANLRLPTGVDARLRCLLVTPDMHRVHHSVLMLETNSNYGFFLPWWDHLFGSYRAQPEAGHDAMVIGLMEFREAGENRLGAMLTQPFRPPHPGH